MPFATDVRLPRSQRPRFPDRCCVCLRPRPGDVLPVARRGGFFWLDLLMPWVILARKPVRCEVPVCATCRVDAIRYRRIQGAVLGVAVVVALLLVKPWVDSFGWSRGTRRYATIGIAIVAIAPILVWLAVRPRAVDLTVSAEWVEYEFADAEYAEDFRALNAEVVDGSVP